MDAGGAGAGGAGGDNEASAQSYDASKSRKSKRKDKNVNGEAWQEKVIKLLEPVEVDVPPPPKKEYIDVALEAVSFQCKENELSKDELLDLADDIQEMVNRVCREKRRRNNIRRNPPPAPAAAGFAPQQQQDLQGAMAIPLNYDPQYYQMWGK